MATRLHEHQNAGCVLFLGPNKRNGLVRDLNPGPLAPEARIIPLDQQAAMFE